ncbi:Hint domain-containing protein [Asaia prunellae]|uniref:Hint domain-containing protein n=1 Tax=Asaia prunellae TaxID=610245 RepID=UPI00046ED483|nr:Hint domain-containing protein [Asaia prunellae]
MALPQLDEQAVGLPTIGTYEVQYTILADAPYNQSAANAKLTKITYNADGTFTIDGVTRSVQYILKTSIGPYSPSYPVMMIKATGGANILLAAPGFDLSKWIFVMPTMGSFQTTVSMSYNAPNATAAEKSTYSRGMYAGVAGWTGKCFLAGALIATPKGQVPVEELSAGDEILCFDCEGNKSVSIIDYVYNGKNQNWFPDLNTESCPVIIKENALADGIPNSDLTVTPEHCIFIDDFFVPVRMLVNGNSIYYDKSKTDYEYYHIYLKNHSIIELMAFVLKDI